MAVELQFRQLRLRFNSQTGMSNVLQIGLRAQPRGLLHTQCCAFRMPHACCVVLTQASTAAPTVTWKCTSVVRRFFRFFFYCFHRKLTCLGNKMNWQQQTERSSTAVTVCMRRQCSFNATLPLAPARPVSVTVSVCDTRLTQQPPWRGDPVWVGDFRIPRKTLGNLNRSSSKRRHDSARTGSFGLWGPTMSGYYLTRDSREGQG